MTTVTQDYDFEPAAKRSRGSSRSYGPARSAPRYKYRGAAAKYRRRVAPSVRRYVKSAISRSLEIKKTYTTANQVAFNAIIDTADVIPLLPGIVQGTGEASRVGNHITVRSMKIKGVFNAFSQGSTVSPTYVDIYIFKNKKANDIPTSAMADFLQVGNSSIDYDGNTRPYSGLLEVNEDVYKDCIHKRFLVYNPQNTLNIAYASAINPSVTFDWDLTPFLKKKWLFNDGTSSCVNDNLFITVGTTQTDGGSTGVVNTGELTYVCEMTYYDA
jgi:hypothetical protein